MKMMIEEERQNHDKEIKRREEAFNEREEQYKTQIKRRRGKKRERSMKR